jgi:predicted membrane channel-forming protein YqfA (hemolysin III family)
MTRQIEQRSVGSADAGAPEVSMRDASPSGEDFRLGLSLRQMSLPPTPQNFPNAVGHALGFLIAVASVPALVGSMPWQASLPIYALLIVVILVLRTYLGTAVRDALSPVRARAILNRVDQSAVFVFIGSVCTVFTLASLQRGIAWVALGALSAVAAFALSAWLLGRARHTVSSSSFLSVLG